MKYNWPELDSWLWIYSYDYLSYIEICQNEHWVGKDDPSPRKFEGKKKFQVNIDFQQWCHIYKEIKCPGPQGKEKIG